MLENKNYFNDFCHWTLIVYTCCPFHFHSNLGLGQIIYQLCETRVSLQYASTWWTYFCLYNCSSLQVASK